ncbi:hypothetical protein ABW19_dt0200913 [Dactylella cylindrospora]|nr:hypothetical protein ABW19_dt0200913 [Dactylella cylindrospora]
MSHRGCRPYWNIMKLPLFKDKPGQKSLTAGRNENTEIGQWLDWVTNQMQTPVFQRKPNNMMPILADICQHLKPHAAASVPFIIPMNHPNFWEGMMGGILVKKPKIPEYQIIAVALVGHEKKLRKSDRNPVLKWPVQLRGVTSVLVCARKFDSIADTRKDSGGYDATRSTLTARYIFYVEPGRTTDTAAMPTAWADLAGNINTLGRWVTLRGSPLEIESGTSDGAKYIILRQGDVHYQGQDIWPPYDHMVELRGLYRSLTGREPVSCRDALELEPERFVGDLDEKGDVTFDALLDLDYRARIDPLRTELAKEMNRVATQTYAGCSDRRVKRPCIGFRPFALKAALMSGPARKSVAPGDPAGIPWESDGEDQARRESRQEVITTYKSMLWVPCLASNILDNDTATPYRRAGLNHITWEKCLRCEETAGMIDGLPYPKPHNPQGVVNWIGDVFSKFSSEFDVVNYLGQHFSDCYFVSTAFLPEDIFGKGFPFKYTPLQISIVTFNGQRKRFKILYETKVDYGMDYNAVVH